MLSNNTCQENKQVAAHASSEADRMPEPGCQNCSGGQSALNDVGRLGVRLPAAGATVSIRPGCCRCFGGGRVGADQWTQVPAMPAAASWQPPEMPARIFQGG